MKKVSIVLPVFNMGDSLISCLDSLVEQSYSNIEIILIDDGSSDNTYEICQWYKQKNKNIKSWHTVNKGSGPARNLGIKKSTGDYVYFMDADDVLESDAIRKMVKASTVSKADLIVFGYKKVDSAGKPVSIKHYKDETYTGRYVRENYHLFFDANFKRGIQGAPWNKLFDLNIIKKHGIIYPDMKRHQDEVFISRYVNQTKNVCFFSSILYVHYINNVNAKWNKFPLNYIDIVKELYCYRVQIMGQWNKSNDRLFTLIYKEYIYNSIKAFDLIFNPRVGMNKKEKISWIEKEADLIFEAEDSLIDLQHKKDIKTRQVLLFLKLIEKKRYGKLYQILKFRVFLETRFNKLIGFIKQRYFNKTRNTT